MNKQQQSTAEKKKATEGETYEPGEYVVSNTTCHVEAAEAKGM